MADRAFLWGRRRWLQDFVYHIAGREALGQALIVVSQNPEKNLGAEREVGQTKRRPSQNSAEGERPAVKCCLSSHVGMSRAICLGICSNPSPTLLNLRQALCLIHWEYVCCEEVVLGLHE